MLKPNVPKKIEVLKTSKLLPYARNSRTHSEAQVQQIAASMAEFGFTNPILIDENDQIIAGHGRLSAAHLLKIEEVPCIRLSHLSETQKKAYVIADNKLALNAGWDDAMLALELKDLESENFDLSLTGFNEDELAKLLVEAVEGQTDPDDVPEVQETAITVLGDIWTLGKHRLMCGDSTNIDSIQELIDDAKIDLIHTDPPYGINEKCDRDFASRSRVANGNKFKQILNDNSIDCAIDAFNIIQTLNIPRQVWWGANYYSHHVPQTANWFVWDKRVEEKQKDMNSDCELAWVKSKWASVRIFRHLWKGLIKESEHGQKRVHPTQKPVALVEWVIDYYKDVETVLDLFGGSGTTLIGCEKKGCSAYLLELEPIYCDVIIKRWQDFTGKKAIHSESGKSFDEMSNERSNNSSS